MDKQEATTALWKLCQSYRVETDERLQKIRSLIEEGHADISTCDPRGWTPLHEAAFNGYSKICRLLVEKGANINEGEGRTTPLHLMCRLYPEMVRALVEMGANVNARDRSGETPLHLAAHGGNDDICQFFIAQGADIHARNNQQWTPLHAAAHFGRAKTCGLLLDAGADINARQDGGCTPLHLAAINGGAEACNLLVVRGADIDAQSNSHWTPALWAAHNGHHKTFQVLAEHGANLDIRGDEGKSPRDYTIPNLADMEQEREKRKSQVDRLRAARKKLSKFERTDEDDENPGQLSAGRG